MQQRCPSVSSARDLHVSCYCLLVQVLVPNVLLISETLLPLAMSDVTRLP